MKLRASLPFNCEVCILAGGLSTRMGRDKSRLRLDHQTILRWVQAAARRLELSVRVIRCDLKPGCGPLGGIYTALKSSHTDTVLFLACDMPFVSTGLLHAVLGNLTSRHRAWFVRHGGRVGFPFLLRRDALPVVIDQVERAELSLQKLAKILKARTIRLPRAMSAELFNINTPADWKKARKRVADLRS